MWHRIAFHPKLTTDTCTQHERWKPQICDLRRCLPKEEWEVKIYLLVFAPVCFLWNNLWSVSRYIMGPFSGWWRLVWRTSPVSNPPIWKCRSGIGDHRFPFFMDLLPNYTFYTNLTFLFIGYLLTEDVTSMITFNLWKVEKVMQHHLMPV